jgi:lauroyl/myristoyl acyltransferase
VAGIKDLVIAAARRAPLPLTAPLVRRRVRRAQADPGLAAVARRQMEFVLGAARPDADLDAVATKHLADMMWRRELRWRPRTITRQHVTGIENVKAPREPGQGLLIAFLHHGRYDGIFGAMAAAGSERLFVAAGAGMFEPDTPPHLLALGRAVERGATMMSTTVGYAGYRDVLLDGRAFAIAVDLPGSSHVRFLGRQLRAASGVARLSKETGAPVVVASASPHARATQELTLSKPLSPDSHPDAASLLQAIFDELEPSVLAWPEAYEWPRAHFFELDADGVPLVHEPDPGEPVFATP